MTKFLCSLLLCAQFCFAPVEVPIYRGFSGDTICTITLPNNNTPGEVRQALNLALGIPQISAGQVCPFEHDFIVGESSLEELTRPLTSDDYIKVVISGGREILVMPVFPNNDNVRVAIIGTQIRKNFRHGFYGKTPIYEDEVELNILLSKVLSWASFIDYNGLCPDYIHELSLHTEKVWIIQENCLHELALKKEPEPCFDGNGDEFWGSKSYPDLNLNICLNGGRVYFNEFSLYPLLNNLMASIKLANGQAPLEPLSQIARRLPGLNLDLDRRITKDDLNRYPPQPWEMKEPIPGDYSQFLKQPIALPQPAPTAQISFIQYISNALARFAQFICPNT